MIAHPCPRIPRGSLVRLIMPTLRCAPPIGLRSPAGTGYLFVLTTLIGLAALTTACGSESEGSATAVVRDSAGVRIVENFAPAPTEAAGWRLSAEPVLSIGLFDGAPEYQFFRATAAFRLDDGGIVVLNAGTHELRFYGPDGRYLRSGGGEGEGPGEFRSPGWLRPFGPDSLVVYDYANRRVSVFDGAGNFGRSFLLKPPDERSWAYPLDVFADRSLLIRSAEFTRPDERGEGVRRDSVLYTRYTAAGQLVDTLGTFIGSESYVKSMGRGYMMSSLLFGRSPSATTQGDGFYFGAGDSYQITRHGPAGQLQTIIRRAWEPTPVTEADVSRLRERRLERIDDEDARERYAGVLEEMPAPETMPAHGRLLTDAGGNLWVPDYSPPGAEGSAWTIFDAGGRMIARVEMPEGLNVTQIGPDFVLGIYRDDLEVEYIHLYELRKDTEGGATN